MGILDRVSKPVDRPIIATICGDSGMGKTTLACTFPKPIVIRGEDGLQSIPLKSRPDAFPVLSDPAELWEQLKALVVEPHEYKTLVIDSVTALERLFIQHIIETDPKQPRGIQQALGGYGAGREAVAAMHARIRKAAGLLAEKRGMHVVFIAHADTERVEPPDDDAYTRWTLRLHQKSQPSYIDDVDVVGFLKLETFTTGDGERKKAISDGTRILVTHAVAANVSKNRYGIVEPIPVTAGENPLAKFIPALEMPAKKEKAQ
jgi:hypothetical protein